MTARPLALFFATRHFKPSRAAFSAPPPVGAGCAGSYWSGSARPTAAPIPAPWPGITVTLSPQLHEFVHVLADERRFEPVEELRGRIRPGHHACRSGTRRARGPAYLATDNLPPAISSSRVAQRRLQVRNCERRAESGCGETYPVTPMTRNSQAAAFVLVADLPEKLGLYREPASTARSWVFGWSSRHSRSPERSQEPS